jgi:SAM-dependent methyltransferase
VADVGCGPGYVTRHLHDLGVDAFGIDLSPEMIAIARHDHPDLGFEVGSMTDLPLADSSLGGVLAFWSVIHIPDSAVPGVFEEFRRVLRPDGSDTALDQRLHRAPDQRRQPPPYARADLPMAARGRVHHRGRAPHAARRRGSGRDRLRPEASLRLIRNEEAYGDPSSIGSSQQTS